MTDAPLAPPPSTRTAGDTITAYLTAQAGVFVRTLPQVSTDAGSRAGTAHTADATEELLRTVRRIGGAVHTFAAVLDPLWAQGLRVELRWLLNVLAAEPGYARRLARLTGALDSLTGPGSTTDAPGMLAGHSGAPKARALLERQLTLARTRTHSSVLQELRSARLHAVADRMTLLTGEVPLLPAAQTSADSLLEQADRALAALTTGAQALPLGRAAVPYGGDALHRLEGSTATARPTDADTALACDDAPWHRVRILTKRARYALEICAQPSAELDSLDRTLGQHQEAADAAMTAADAARTPRITPATAYVLGVVHADQRLEVEAARYVFSRQWPELLNTGFSHHGRQPWVSG